MKNSAICKIIKITLILGFLGMVVIVYFLKSTIQLRLKSFSKFEETLSLRMLWSWHVPKFWEKTSMFDEVGVPEDFFLGKKITS